MTPGMDIHTVVYQTTRLPTVSDLAVDKEPYDNGLGNTGVFTKVFHQYCDPTPFDGSNCPYTAGCWAGCGSGWVPQTQNRISADKTIIETDLQFTSTTPDAAADSKFNYIATGAPTTFAMTMYRYYPSVKTSSFDTVVATVTDYDGCKTTTI